MVVYEWLPILNMIMNDTEMKIDGIQSIKFFEVCEEVKECVDIGNLGLKIVQTNLKFLSSGRKVRFSVCLGKHCFDIDLILSYRWVD
jgi:hypothetical protein